MVSIVFGTLFLMDRCIYPFLPAPVVDELSREKKSRRQQFVKLTFKTKSRNALARNRGLRVIISGGVVNNFSKCSMIAFAPFFFPSTSRCHSQIRDEHSPGYPPHNDELCRSRFVTFFTCSNFLFLSQFVYIFFADCFCT